MYRRHFPSISRQDRTVLAMFLGWTALPLGQVLERDEKEKIERRCDWWASDAFRRFLGEWRLCCQKVLSISLPVLSSRILEH